MSVGPQRSAGRLLAAAAALAAGAVALALWAPFPLGADDWFWRRMPEPVWERAAFPAIVLSAIGALVAVAWGSTERGSRWREGLILVAFYVLSVLAHVTVTWHSPAGYHEALFAVGMPGPAVYHTEARRIKALKPHLRSYEREMRREFRGQISTHPAGPVVLFWCLNRLFAGNDAGAMSVERWFESWVAPGTSLAESPKAEMLFSAMSAAERAGAWLATLGLQAFASLLCVVAYAMARAWYGRRVALMAAALTAVIPSVLLFSPGIDQCFPVGAVVACWLGYGAGRHRSAWRAGLAGLTVSVGLFFTLAFGVVAAWSGLLGVVGLCQGDRRPGKWDVAKLVSAGAVGFVLPVTALYGAFRYNSFAVWRACWEGNATFNEVYQRTYWKWLLLNPLEYLAFLGVPVACLFIRQLAGEAWELAHQRAGGRDWGTLSAAGLLIALNVLGANLGEVARLWMFLMPACAVAAAAAVERYAPYRRAVFFVIFGLQAAQVVLFKGALDVMLGPYRSLGG